MDPYLVLSKLFWLIAEPATVVFGVWILGTLLLWTPWFRFGRIVVGLAALFALANAMLPIGAWALKPIEDRFPPLLSLPPRVDGILVLGGVINESVIGVRGLPRSLAAAGSPRLDAFLELARRYPMAKHVFTGGSIELINDRDTEADIVRRIFARLGLDTTRILFEDRSRNTWENARYSYDMIKPEPEELWILITSARHMPRAIGTFRQAGWKNLLAFPIDYVTGEGAPPIVPSFGLGANLGVLGEAIREYIGLFVYWYLGRTNALFPSA
jgi:uncharacterized SAM-binding protein YcdF (DUF218 family)